MLLGLWHEAIIGRHNEEHRINGDDAGKHVLDEFFVAGDVNEGDVITQEGEAQINGHRSDDGVVHEDTVFLSPTI